MTTELNYDERDYEIGGALYDGPDDVVEEEDKPSDDKDDDE